MGVVIGLVVLMAIIVINNSDRRSSDARLSSYATCVELGNAYYKEIGSWPLLSDGREASTTVREMCRRSTGAFGRPAPR